MPDTRNTFNSISTVYNLINNIISLGNHKKWKKRLVLGHPIKGNVLDIATGTGDIIYLIEEYWKDSSLYAIDPSNKMLEIAIKKNFKKNINFSENYCEDLNFNNNFFDFITISFGIRNTKSIGIALSECKRVMKKGATLKIMEFSKSENIFLSFLTTTYLYLIIPFIGLLFGKFKEYFYLSSSISNFYTPKQFKEILLENGFQIKEVDTFNLGLVTIYTTTKP